MSLGRLTAHLPLILAGVAALIGGFVPSSFEALRSALFLFVLVFSSGILGPTLAPKLPRAVRGVIAGLVILAGQSILQTAWYYLGGDLRAVADGLGLGLSILLITGTVGLWPLQKAEVILSSKEPVSTSEAGWGTMALVACVAAAVFLVVCATQAATIRSINSPWALLPSGTFIAIATLFASSFLASLKTRRSVVAAIVALSLLTFASLTTWIYPLGYGFDGFLHRASEDVILKTGTLEPAPPSYIGQYTLVTWLARNWRIIPRVGDVWLVGVLALLLPLAAWHISSKKRGHNVIVSLLLTIPFGIISATTPQNVAYILGLLALLWLLPTEDEEGGKPSFHHTHPVVPWSLLAWSLATHPLAGMPFALAGIALLAQRLRSERWRNAYTLIALIGSVVAVPLAFALRAALQSGVWSWTWLQAIKTSGSWIVARFVLPATHLALWPDWANWQSALLSFALLGAAIFAFLKDRTRRPIWSILIAFSAGAAASSWLLQTSGDFSFLISYERQDYATRLLIVAQLFLVCPALIGISHWFEYSAHTHPRMRAAALLLGVGWFCANVYNGLPRHDAAAIGHGWSVGKSDIEAVQFIEKQANGKPYTVLANQTVSAAAVSTYGFKRYADDVFFYPIPTGGPLYERFLQMMDKPDLDIAHEAGDLGQSKLVYVVVNSYWWRAEQVIEQLKIIADRTWNVERGAAYIFLFDLSTSSSASSTRPGT